MFVATPVTDDEFAQMVAESKTWMDLARRCGATRHQLPPLKKKALNLRLDTSHFKNRRKTEA
jgi:hypothetical protein